MKKTSSGQPPVSAARQSTGNEQVSTDWRERMLAQLRAVIHQADPAIVEERKWKKPLES